MVVDNIETFKIINGIYNYGDIFSIFHLELEIYDQYKFQKLSYNLNLLRRD